MKKTLLPLAAVGLSSLIAITSFAADNSKDSKAPGAAGQPESLADKPSPPTKLPESLKEEKKREQAVDNHILPENLAVMEQPPPPPRAETQPPAPGEGFKWKPGHWAVVNKQWAWVPGEWGMPPQTSSVWIEGRWDEKTKKWSAPYWQADRPETYASEPEMIERKKF